jgi:hypothetical protein
MVIPKGSNPKVQIPRKVQGSRIKKRRHASLQLDLESWNFLGPWNLEFDPFARRHVSID